jgi:hypothetical protein
MKSLFLQVGQVAVLQGPLVLPEKVATVERGLVAAEVVAASLVERVAVVAMVSFVLSGFEP